MNDDISARLAANLKRFREERGLSQASLAEISGVPRPTIAHLESGQANPTLSVVLRVAASLDVSIEGLVDEAAPALVVRTVRELPVKKSARSRRVVVASRGTLREPEVHWLSLKPEARLKLGESAEVTHVLVVQSGAISVQVGERSESVHQDGVVQALGEIVVESGEGAEILHVQGRAP